MWYSIVIAAFAGYLLGNFNGAVCISAWVAHEDVRTKGSGNAGLTNFLRNYGGWSALLVILMDIGKTVAACLVGGALLERYGYGLEGRMLGGVAASLGHDFPVFLGFKGGKGILSGATVAFMIDWRIGVLLVLVFLVSVLLTRYVSLGSILGAIGFGVGFVVLYWNRPWVAVGGVFLALLAIFMHRANVKRLIKGTENKFTIKKKEKS